MSIKIQNKDFELSEEYQRLTSENKSDGAVVTFIGMVRDFNQGNEVTGLFLEHYPGMTEKALAEIVEKAKDRWELGRVNIIHRIGQLDLGDQIVFVGVTAKHRGNAFKAAEFIMDFLKTQAPFWKKETTTKCNYWIEVKTEDHNKAKSWQ